MEEILIVILKGGELAADLFATVYERFSSNDEDGDDDREQPQSDHANKHPNSS